MLRSFSRSHILLGAVIAVAAFFRFYRLDTLPPGLQFDQAFYVFDSIRLLQGEFHLLFPAPGFSEPLFLYLSMVGVSLFGDSALGIKLTSALLGVLTVPLIYGLVRCVFRSTTVALLSALFTAISVWSIFYGRYGERITLLDVWVILIFWYFWRAIDKRRRRDYAMCGLFVALGLYTNLAGRVLPLALILMTIYVAWTDRPQARVYLKGLVLAGAVAAIVFLPLAVYYVYHPDQFFTHAAQVSIFVPHAGESGDVPSALARNGLRLLGMFFVRGDDGIIRNVPGRPVFDPFVGALFVAGVITWGYALVAPRSNATDRRRAAFLGVWLFTAMILSFITDDAPNFSRLHPAIPAVMILPAWGAAALGARLRTAASRRVATALLLGIIATSAALTYRDYFFDLANDPALYYAFDTDKVDAARWINENAGRTHIYLAPVWYQVGTISLLTRKAPLKTFDSRDTIVLPSRSLGHDAVFAFPLDQEKKGATMLSRLGSLATSEGLTGSNGNKHLLLYRVPAENLPAPEDPVAALARGGSFIQPQTLTSASWADRFELFGYTLSPEGPGGRNLTVNLFLRGLTAMSADYTFSVKVRDAKSRTWGQEDKWPGDNSYATSQWSAGDIIVEKFYPGLSACAPAGEYTVSVEVYNPKRMETLALTSGAGAATLGRFQAGASGGNRFEDLEPDQTRDVKVGDRLRLSGYTLSADSVTAGGDLSLSLFWQGVGGGSTEPVSVRVGDRRLVDGTVVVPPEGRGLCTLYDLTLPKDLPVGPAALWVNNSKIAEVQVDK